MYSARTSARILIMFVLYVGSCGHLFGLVDRVTSATIRNDDLTVTFDARPVVTTDRFVRDGTCYFILSFEDSILAGPARVLSAGNGLGPTVDIAQYKLDPDIVHIVIKSSYRVNLPMHMFQRKADRYAMAVALIPRDDKRIFLDVGHGGYDPGGTGPDGLPESFVNLSIAKKLASILQRAGMAVELDRTTNAFVSLPRRVVLADKSGAALFLGLYCNASSDPAIHGTTTYYYHRNSYKFANYLVDHVARTLGLANDGVIKDNLYVIRYTSQRMVDVLIEYAYISNSREEQLLSSPWFRNRIASALADAVIGYFGSRAAEAAAPAHHPSVSPPGAPVDLPLLPSAPKVHSVGSAAVATK